MGKEYTFAGAGKTSGKAFALAAEAEVLAFSMRVPMGYPAGRAVIVEADLQKQVGKLGPFYEALQREGFTVSNRMADGNRVMIGVITAVQQYVNGVVNSSGESEDQIKSKYGPAINAYQRAKYAHEENLKSLKLKASAHVLALKRESTTYTQRELAAMLGAADIDGVIACVKELGVSVEKVDDHASGFTATAATEDTLYYIFEVPDLATLEACQEAAIKVAWPPAEEAVEEQLEG